MPRDTAPAVPRIAGRSGPCCDQVRAGARRDAAAAPARARAARAAGPPAAGAVRRCRGPRAQVSVAGCGCSRCWSALGAQSGSRRSAFQRKSGARDAGLLAVVPPTGIAGFQPARRRSGSMPGRRRLCRHEGAGAAGRPALHHGRSLASAPQVARRGHRAPGARGRLKAGDPNPCRLKAGDPRLCRLKAGYPRLCRLKAGDPRLCRLAV
jgi:hypothetical protein